MKKMLVPGLMYISVLLALSSCKKDGPSATAAGANADPVLLLDAGAERQALLRYKIAEGTTTKSNMDFTMATLAFLWQRSSTTGPRAPTFRCVS